MGSGFADRGSTFGDWTSQGPLWLADVGQDAIEEIDFVTVGGNYGWNRLEGEACFLAPSSCERAGKVLPVATYTHAEGRSVTGGAVYRGGAVPGLRGWYIYSDAVSGTIWGLPSDGSGPVVVLGETDLNVVSFGVDAEGELYVVDFGVILRIELAP